jgi:hypothetical protein
VTVAPSLPDTRAMLRAWARHLRFVLPTRRLRLADADVGEAWTE